MNQAFITRSKAIAKAVANYFDISSYLIPQEDAEADIRAGVSFRGINMLILIVAIFMASVGLNVNSVAVIIGAMLISPLMGPIIGIGLAVGVHDFDLMKRSAVNLFMAALFSILTSMLYFFISPVNEGHSELLARTSPSIYDVVIGFFGGAAGILAVGSKVKGNVLPGVAIATALMPPLCTVGYGLATLQIHYFLGAFYLFFINSVFIAVATFAGVRLMRYKIHDTENVERAKRVRTTVYVITILTMLPALYLTYVMYKQNSFQMNCTQFVNEQFKFPSTQVLGYKANYSTRDGNTLNVTLIGKVLPEDSLVVALTDKLPHYHLGGTRLHILQGESTSNFNPTQATSAVLSDIYRTSQTTISRQNETIDSLRQICMTTARNDSLGAVIAPELKVLFPQIADIAITKGISSNINTHALDTINVALVRYSTPISRQQFEKLQQYLQARLTLKHIDIMTLN